MTEYKRIKERTYEKKTAVVDAVALEARIQVAAYGEPVHEASELAVRMDAALEAARKLEEP